MTDDIVKRLEEIEIDSECPCIANACGRAADALEAQAKRIDHLEEMRAGWKVEAIKHAEEALKHSIRARELEAALKQSARVEASLASRIANLMDALEPFADVKVYPVLEDTTRVYDEPITYGDLRAARAAYLGEKE